MVKFSALNRDGLAELQQLLTELLEPGPYYYPPDLVTDQPERFIYGLIREQILLLTHEEVPHSVAIAIDKVEKHQRLLVYSLPYTLSAPPKGILIGKGGMLKAIGSAAREQIQKLIAGKVYLSYL